jgi:hypothetical protein
MKNYKIYMILSLLFFIASCEKDNEIKFTELGTEFFISGSFTSLDNEATLSIENQQSNIMQIDAIHLRIIDINDEGDFNNEDTTIVESSVGIIPIINGDGSITLSEVTLGMTEIGWRSDFQFDASFDGKAIQRFFTLTVDDPISVEDPGVTIRNDTVYHFTFAIEPASATVETVTVQTKVSTQGTYVPLPGPFNAEDSIAITGSNYAVGDTLFVKVTGTVGSKTAETETGLAIGALSVSHMESFKLDNTPDQAFDFIAADYVVTSQAGENADIEFIASYGTNGLIVGFEANQKAMFVPGTSLEYDAADSLSLINMDFSGAITSDDNVAEGNVYYFRTRRGSGAWFIGILKVAKLDKPQGILEDSYMEIEYKY